MGLALYSAKVTPSPKSEAGPDEMNRRNVHSVPGRGLTSLLAI